ncbi:cytochrome P450 [Colletotrichum paranaense]|uniref:Cytochrome P450 n=1 Tax=Colletotrichum paranaense TaxID=1914294 RepID=A0ABQ9T4U5_9PEZI|nr:cytochrome P450 [Colletotrichum paranaense]KAK1546156.1 cytochrome P450 [Colletotrichum paranaense]
MSSNFSFELGGAPYTIPSPTEKPIAYVAAVVLFVSLAYALGDHGAKLPEINPLKPFELSNTRRILEFYQTSKELMLKGRAKFGDNPWKLMTEWGNCLVLPPDFIHELRSNPNLAFVEPAKDDSHGYIPGFDAFDGDEALPTVVTKYLTKALTKLTKPLSEESTLVLRHVLTDSTGISHLRGTEWHKMSPQQDIMRIVSRLSSRVFAGEELCRDEEWVRVSSEYTAAAFGVGYEVGQWPRWARPIVHWFLPSCWRVRALLNECRKTLQPHMERRTQRKREAVAAGKTGAVFDDAVEWFEKESSRKPDPATQQISLSLVAIHTTTDLLTQTMIDLAEHPELFQPLRDELVRVLSKEGLKKTALYNLKLMDSVIKESQRMKPVLLSTWRRLVMKDVTLSNGFVLRKGQKVIATNTHMWDANYYENPATYDGYRFLNMRGTDEEKNAHLVSTSAKHPGFGHGQHACPGRFFAANEVKIALAHLLLKYDWKFPDGFKPQTVPHGMVLLPDPSATLLIRRRKEELDLDSLEC